MDFFGGSKPSPIAEPEPVRQEPAVGSPLPSPSAPSDLTPAAVPAPQPAATIAPAGTVAPPVQVTDALAGPVSELRNQIVEAIKTVYDPEIPVNIYDMGLIYDIAIDAAGSVGVKMTLTSPGCPEAVTIPPRVEAAVRTVAGVTDAHVNVVWEPPWDPARMSEAAKLQLGWMGM